MSKKEELQNALVQLDNLKRRVQAKLDEIIDAERPKIGDVCKFWNDNENDFVISKLTRFYDYGNGFYTLQNIYYFNAKRLTKQQAIDLLFGKEADND